MEKHDPVSSSFVFLLFICLSVSLGLFSDFKLPQINSQVDTHLSLKPWVVYLLLWLLCLSFSVLISVKLWGLYTCCSLEGLWITNLLESSLEAVSILLLHRLLKYFLPLGSPPHISLFHRRPFTFTTSTFHKLRKSHVFSFVTMHFSDDLTCI